MIVYLVMFSPLLLLIVPAAIHWLRWNRTPSGRAAHEKEFEQAAHKDAYRIAAPAPLNDVAVVEAVERRYCSNCKHFAWRYPAIKENPECHRLGYEDNPILGPNAVALIASCAANANYDCKSYEKRGR